MDREKLWKNAKTSFVTLVLKEANKVGKEKLVANVIDKKDGELVKAFQELDKWEKAFDALFDQRTSKPNAVQDLQKLLFEASLVTTRVRSHVKSMLESLQQAIDRFKTEDAPGNPKMKENLVRGLKVLKTGLDAIAKSNDAWATSSAVRVHNEANNLAAFDILWKQFVPSVRSSIARGLAAAQRIKANPTREVYNQEFPVAARDIIMSIGPVKKIREKGYKIPGPEDTTSLVNALDEFNTGKLSTVDQNKSSQEILALASHFNKAVKAVADAYKLK